MVDRLPSPETMALAEEMERRMMVEAACVVTLPGTAQDDPLGYTPGAPITFTIDCSCTPGVPGSRSGGHEQLAAGVLESQVPYTVKLPLTHENGDPVEVGPDASITYLPSGKHLTVKSVITGQTRQTTVKLICLEAGT